MSEGTAAFLKKANVEAVQGAVEQLNNLKVEVQQQDSAGNIISRVSAIIVRSPRGMTISIPAFTSSGTNTSTGQQVFGGSGAPSAATLPVGSYTSGQTPDLYFNTAIPSNPIPYYCATSGTVTAGNPPTNTSVWTQFSVPTEFTIASVSGDYITSTTGVTIAKPPNLRRSLASETFDGTEVIYQYNIDSDGTGNYRVAYLAGNLTTAETQVMVPRYKPSSLDANQDTIFAIPTAFTGVAAAPVWLEIKPARMWVMQY